jgi:hypothetical protein
MIATRIVAAFAWPGARGADESWCNPNSGIAYSDSTADISRVHEIMSLAVAGDSVVEGRTNDRHNDEDDLPTGSKDPAIATLKQTGTLLNQP